MNFYRRPRFPNPQTGFIYLIILAIPLAPIACVINLFTNDISYEEHYKRAEIARLEYRNQINKDILISNVSFSEARVNYTLTNASNRDITAVELSICWGDGTKYLCDDKWVGYGDQMKFGLAPNQSEEISSSLWSAALASGKDNVQVTNVKISIDDIRYKDDCRNKPGWDGDRDIECNYIHGIDYLFRPGERSF